MTENIDRFIQDSSKLVGSEATDVPMGWSEVDWPAIRRFTSALGDRNNLYFDPVYTLRTRYQSLLAPPSYLAGVRTPTASGTFTGETDYGLAAMQSGVEFEWFDVIRLGQKLKNTLTLTGVKEGKRTAFKGKRTAELSCDATYSGFYEGLIGKAKGNMTFVPFESGKELFLDREVYAYSDKEIEKITAELDNVIKTPPRGMVPLYWGADVKVGDELPQLVKHITYDGLSQWTVAEGKERLRANLILQNLKNMPNRVVTNPTTNWPYWDVYSCADDINSCRAGGYNAPYARGLHLACLASQLLTNWMGDDGFLRSLKMEFSVPNTLLYGDTMWIRGKVADKYKEKVGGEEYRAVDVSVEEINQLGETIGKGSAIIYLPDRGYQVKLPIPADY